jgi:hypothetical protein
MILSSTSTGLRPEYEYDQSQNGGDHTGTGDDWFSGKVAGQESTQESTRGQSTPMEQTIGDNLGQSVRTVARRSLFM